MVGTITYQVNGALTVDDFQDVLRRSTLGERRPVDDRQRLEQMLRHANLTITAHDGHRLVGVARSLTDFAYVAYLSDLAVDEAYQRRGIGRELIRRTQQELDPGAKILLLAAPAAEHYYPRIGFTHHPRAWLLLREDTLL